MFLIIISGNVNPNHSIFNQAAASEPAQVEKGDISALFSITIELENSTVKTGEDIVLLISIEAEEGFNSVVNLELEINFVGYNMAINMFPLNPPFPRMQEAIIEVPLKARYGKAEGILRATSGDNVVINTFWLTLLSKDDSNENIREYAEAPFMVKLASRQLSVEPGGIALFDVEITIDEGFNESINIIYNYTSLNYTSSKEFTKNPPYPSHPLLLLPSVTVPKYLVPGVPFQLTVKATSSIYSIEKTTKISIKGESGFESHVNWLFSLFERIWSELILMQLKLRIGWEQGNPEAQEFIYEAYTRSKYQYFGDKSTMTYHKTSCSEWDNVSKENREYYHFKDIPESLGYKPCDICKP